MGGFTLLTASFTSLATDLAEQREIYRKINEILSISKSENSQQLATQLLQKITDYPLYPYAEYQLLKAQIDQLSLAQIEAYQQRQPELAFAERLKKEWLKQRQQMQDWATISANSAKLGNDQATQCVILQAQTNMLLSPQAEKNNVKNDEKSTALLQANLPKLWLTGKSLPSQCDPLIAQWHLAGGLTPELARQRALLAFEAGNSNLLNHLQQLLTDDANKQWVAELLDLLKNPEKLTDSNAPYYVEKLTAENPQHQRIFSAILPAYLQKLSENQLELDPQKHAQHWQSWATRLGINESKISEWKKIYLSKFFDSENAIFQQWRDEQLTLLKDDKLIERRIRMAIREKMPQKSWLELLSPQAQQKEEWQYWIAQNSSPEKKQQILTALSTQRSFYAILAAKELGIAYQPEMLSLADPVPNEKMDSEKSDTTQNTVEPVEQRFANILARIAELRYLKDDVNMNAEWLALLKAVNTEQQLQLANYAAQQNWYELSVEATIQAKAWGYLSLRLPNAYADWFDLHLNGKKINRTFAMAIARQESAWRANVSSSADARGLMQLLPSTAKLTAQQAKLPYQNEAQLFDPFYNIMLGTAHLQQLYDKYGNNRILIAAAYNAGAHRVDKWLEKSQGKLTMAEFVAAIPFFETRGYVQNVLAYDAYQQILQQQTQVLFSKDEQDRLY
ncbi:lytic murein transglycosylase [Pasteurellaceae bacterium Pebbles2]|nr:lytic murein transglycosylase [Pasteurellaceae bacterium Pebbles2]